MVIKLPFRVLRGGIEWESKNGAKTLTLARVPLIGPPLPQDGQRFGPPGPPHAVKAGGFADRG
jgi:hypothetical protein